MSEAPDRTSIVVGASRGLGRGIATALAEPGSPVIAVARTRAALAELPGENRSIQTEVADAGDPSVAGSLLDRYDPDAVVLVAGATRAWPPAICSPARGCGSCPDLGPSRAIEKRRPAAVSSPG